MANNKLNKNILTDLLKDDEVRAQVEALIVELLGKDKGALLLALLSQIQENQTTTVKKPWWKKVFGWVVALLPYIKTIFVKK